MVVKLLQNENLQELEKEINELEDKLFKEFQDSLPKSVLTDMTANIREWSLRKFRYDIKVVPAHYEKTTFLVDGFADGKQETRERIIDHPISYLAVIQY